MELRLYRIPPFSSTVTPNGVLVPANASAREPLFSVLGANTPVIFRLPRFCMAGWGRRFVSRSCAHVPTLTSAAQSRSSSLQPLQPHPGGWILSREHGTFFPCSPQRERALGAELSCKSSVGLAGIGSFLRHCLQPLCGVYGGLIKEKIIMCVMYLVLVLGSILPVGRCISTFRSLAGSSGGPRPRPEGATNADRRAHTKEVSVGTLI